MRGFTQRAAMHTSKPSGAYKPEVVIGPATAERRAHARYDVASHVRVVDPESSQVLGDIVDISIDGLRLQVAAGADLGGSDDRPLRLVVHLGGRVHDPIDVVAALRWQRDDLLAGQRHAGFEFVYLSLQAVNQIDAFVQELAG